MTPNTLSKTEDEKVEEKITDEVKDNYKAEIIWSYVARMVIVHVCTIYGIYLLFTRGNMMRLFIFGYIYGTLGGLGITAGYHRLWSHRAYKAKWPLRVLLCLFATIAAQNDTIQWCRDHRVHHKYSDTDADPHNIRRGFFYAHMGWLMCKKHPDVTTKGKSIAIDDLWADPIVRFHRKYYTPMFLFLCIILPTMIPVWLWGESAWVTFFVCGVGRYCISLHFTWLVNSAAHTFGNQPYDKYIKARENWFVSIVAVGEGWHNYHHVFPWDYATSELGYTINFSTAFIDFMGWLGLAYDMKTTNPDVIKNKKLETGDGSRLYKIKDTKIS